MKEERCSPTNPASGSGDENGFLFYNLPLNIMQCIWHKMAETVTSIDITNRNDNII